jgi:hypothetical protein
MGRTKGAKNKPKIVEQPVVVEVQDGTIQEKSE